MLFKLKSKEKKEQLWVVTMAVKKQGGNLDAADVINTLVTEFGDEQIKHIEIRDNKEIW